MATIHVSEAEAARDFAELMAQVRAGVEVVIEQDSQPVAVLHMPAPVRHTIKECLALMPEESIGVIDEDFTRDVEEGARRLRGPLTPPAWD